jgi:hypothetical protein
MSSGRQVGRDRAVDRLVRRQVDAERLLAQQVLPRLEDGDVDLLVQVVRDGAVDGLDLVVVQQGGEIGREARSRVEPVVPGERVGARVAHVDEPRPDAQR